MPGSRTIRVIKRDGGIEPFNLGKLTAAIWAAMHAREGDYYDARELAAAVMLYAQRLGWPCITTAAVFEVALKVLRRMRLKRTARAFEAYRQLRRSRRKRLRLVHKGGEVTCWDKSWLAQVACKSWRLQPATGRILAAYVEKRLLSRHERWVSRGEALDLLNEEVVHHGLASAVPLAEPSESVEP